MNPSTLSTVFLKLYQLPELPVSTPRLSLIDAIAPSPVSQALPSRDAAREYAKAEPA